MNRTALRAAYVAGRDAARAEARGEHPGTCPYDVRQQASEALAYVRGLTQEREKLGHTFPS